MADLMRVSIQGALPSGEEWSVNPVWGLGDAGTPTTPEGVQTVATAIAALIFNTGVTAMWSTSTTYTGVRCEARSSAGVLENQGEAVRGTPQAGTGANPHPYQTAAVVSLKSTRVGASGRGRLYFPATGAALTVANLRLVGSTQTAFRDGVKAFLLNTQAAIRVTYPLASLIVWSRVNASKANVTSLQVGDVLDVQRRRRDTLIENYSSGTYP